MIKAVLAVLLLIAPATGLLAQQGSRLDMSAVEALATIGRGDLTGVFSFVPAKDSPAAFADLLLRDQKAQKKYVAKVEKDFKVAGGITEWDRAVLQDVVTFYGSPAAENMKKPDAKLILRMAGLVSAPAATIEQIEAKRGRL